MVLKKGILFPVFIIIYCLLNCDRQGVFSFANDNIIYQIRLSCCEGWIGPEQKADVDNQN